MVDISKLTQEEKDQLFQQMQAEQKAAEENKKKAKESYIQLRDLTVEKVFARLQKVSSDLEKSKQEFYDEFNALLELKTELYGVKDDQKSHDWSNADGTVTITTGFNSIDNWDDTKTIGLAKIKAWLEKQPVHGDAGKYVAMVRELLKPNRKDELRANRVIDLVNVADKFGDPELIEAVNILMQSHKTVRSGTYIKALYTNEHGEKVNLPLSFSSIK